MSQSIGDILADHRADKEADPPLETQEVKEVIADSQEPEPFKDDGEKTVSEVEFDDKSPTVPVAAFTQQRRKYTDTVEEMRKETEALKREMAVMSEFIRKGGTQQPQAKPQEPPKLPDFDWDNPGGWTTQVIQAELQKALAPVHSYVVRLSEGQSKGFAVAKHGAEKVNAAFAAMEEASKNDPSVGPDYYRILQSGDAYEELVKWHERREMFREYGNDPAAMRAKIEAEVLDGLRSGKMQKPAAAKPRLEGLPTDLADARSVAPRAGPGWSGPRSIRATLGR